MGLVYSSRSDQATLCLGGYWNYDDGVGIQTIDQATRCLGGYWNQTRMLEHKAGDQATLYSVVTF